MSDPDPSHNPCYVRAGSWRQGQIWAALLTKCDDSYILAPEQPQGYQQGVCCTVVTLLFCSLSNRGELDVHNAKSSDCASDLYLI